MNRSLLPKSLFSASTLKREPVQQTIESEESQVGPTTRKRKASVAETSVVATQPQRPIETRKRHSIQEDSNAESSYQSRNDDNDSVISYSSSSSSSEEEEDIELNPLKLDNISFINRNTNQLLLKLERQQSKQNKYLSKLKHLNKSIRKTSRLLGSNASALAELISSGKESSRSIESNVQPKRHIAIQEEQPKLKQRKVDHPKKRQIDEEEDDEVTIVEKIPQMAKRTQPKITPTKKVHQEIELGTSDTLDTFTILRKHSDVVFGKKPRSLLYNIADSPNSKNLCDLMITTSLDGDLQFWNAKNRKNVKTIGKDHLYDSWIDDICWATPSTLAFCPPQKSTEPVKLIHVGNVTKSNVEGRIQTLPKQPHENGISVIAPLDTGSISRNMEKCSFVTGGYDKSVYLWNLQRESDKDNFTSTGVTRLNIKHTSALFSLYYDKYKDILYSGGADERFSLYDLQTNTVLRELRLAQRVSHINQSKANPNIMLVTTTLRTDQFLIYDQRAPSYDGIKLKFGQLEQETLSRFIKPDMHENGYTVTCGSQSSSKINFWDIRYTGVSRNPSFTLDTSGTNRILRSMFIPNTDTIVSISSNRSMTWIDYSVQNDVIIKTFT